MRCGFGDYAANLIGVEGNTQIGYSGGTAAIVNINIGPVANPRTLTARVVINDSHADTPAATARFVLTAFAPLRLSIVDQVPFIRRLPASPYPSIIVGRIQASGGIPTGANYRYSGGSAAGAPPFSVFANGNIATPGAHDNDSPRQMTITAIADDGFDDTTPPVSLAYTIFFRDEMAVAPLPAISVTTGNLNPQALVNVLPGAGIVPYRYSLITPPGYIVIGANGTISALLTPQEPETITASILIADSDIPPASITTLLTLAAVEPPPPITLAFRAPGFRQTILLSDAPNNSANGQTVARLIVQGGASRAYQYEWQPQERFVRIEENGDIIMRGADALGNISAAIGNLNARFIVRDGSPLTEDATITAAARAYETDLNIHHQPSGTTINLRANNNNRTTLRRDLNELLDYGGGAFLARRDGSICCTLQVQTPEWDLQPATTGTTAGWQLFPDEISDSFQQGIYSITLNTDPAIAADLAATAHLDYAIRYLPFSAAVSAVIAATVLPGELPTARVAIIQNFHGYGGYRAEELHPLASVVRRRQLLDVYFGPTQPLTLITLTMRIKDRDSLEDGVVVSFPVSAVMLSLTARALQYATVIYAGAGGVSNALLPLSTIQPAAIAYPTIPAPGP